MSGRFSCHPVNPVTDGKFRFGIPQESSRFELVLQPSALWKICFVHTSTFFVADTIHVARMEALLYQLPPTLTGFNDRNPSV
eukprot:746085-Hanusia_phi.AAC.2